MYRLVARFEMVTPLFLGGAEPRGSPEIRAPSIRGALRYWLRAILGALTVEELKSAEAEVFGDTQQASPVVVRAHSAAEVSDFSPGSFGLKYLFFSLLADGGQPARQCFDAGNEMQLDMFFRSKREGAWLKACVALWLLTRLGGLGARSQRGAGALQLKDSGLEGDWPSALPPLAIQAPTPRALVTELGNDLVKLRRVVGTIDPVSIPTEFDILAPQACRIWVLVRERPWQTWMTALNAVGATLQKGRSLPSKKQIDFVRDARDTGTRLPDIGRASLGLPIVFRDVQSNETVGTLQAIGDNSPIERRASPLHLRVIKLSNEAPLYTVILTWFNSRFVPPGSQLNLRGTNVTGDLPAATWMDDEFWPTFDDRMNAERVEVKFR